MEYDSPALAGSSRSKDRCEPSLAVLLASKSCTVSVRSSSACTGPRVGRLAAMASPLEQSIHQQRARLGDLIDAHVAFAEALAASATESGAARLWAGDAGEAAANFIAELRQAASGFAPMPGDRYPALLGGLLSAQAVRPRYGRHPRLAIWGPLEARLQHADLLVLGGLNEGTWHADIAAGT